jgi:hypothetical protein
MRPDGEAAAVTVALDHVCRRLAMRYALRAVGWGAVVAALVLVAMRLAGVAASSRSFIAAGVGLGSATTMFLAARDRRGPRQAARAVERMNPSLRNLVVTAEELVASPDRVAPYMRRHVLREAATTMAAMDAGGAVPLTRDVVIALAALGVTLLLVRPVASYPSGSSRLPIAIAAVTAADDVIVELTPPSYTARPMQRLRNPHEVEALAGSAVVIRVAGVADAQVRLNGVAIAAGADGATRATLVESGAIAIDGPAVHALVPLTVVPDAVPDVHVTVPARDLRVTDATSAIAVHAAATDDLGLRMLAFRYTVVSGAGEQFTFKEGTLPTTVTKSSPRAWSADATLSLGSLHLEPGDALVYRAVAADARPNSAGEASSDTFFIEIAGPGDVALDGIDMPPDKERYALSEAMIVVKIDRLLARQNAMPRAELEGTAANIAAEQRAVRANFVFMLGGEVEDEVVEAETSHEIQEGRLANQARRDIVAATLLMAKVEQALAAVAPAGALPPAKEAVRTLQRAFGHSRYLLRALPARIRVDPARRSSGDLAGVRDWQRELLPPAGDARTDAARLEVGELLAVSNRLDAAAIDRLTHLAERAIAIEPGARDVQKASRDIVDARDALARGETSAASTALRTAVQELLPRAQRGRLDGASVDPDVLRLAGAAAVAGGGPR